LTSANPLVAPLIAIAIALGGVRLMFGNHEHGKVAIAMALVGGAVILSAQQMAAANSHYSHRA
jgi:hypothetical protein